jgi:hypothetical protein
MSYLEAEDRADTFVAHAYDEHIVDVGEVRLNYSVLEEPTQPALLLVPAQSESWWGYEDVMPLLAEHFQVYGSRLTWPGSIDLDSRALHRGQHGQ